MASVLCIFILVLSVLSPDCLAAADSANNGGYLAGYENTDPQPSQMSWWSTLAYLISLLAVFAFVVVMAYFASKFLGGRFANATGQSGGKILEHLPLGPNKSVCVVELGGKTLMLGVTDHQVTLLGEVTDPEEIERLRRQSIIQPIDDSIFASQLSTLDQMTKRIPSFIKDSIKRRR
ncbi:MAG: flagellar biosynthetic protein FliO [Anaerovibrio sp.]|nr:flagellar biosynthetic protein FliO [Anaerovibrio sp.]